MNTWGELHTAYLVLEYLVPIHTFIACFHRVGTGVHAPVLNHNDKNKWDGREKEWGVHDITFSSD
jgi:hypothetical protein